MTKSTTKIFFLAFVLTGLAACVSASRFKKMKNDDAATIANLTTQVAADNKQIQDLKSKIQGEEDIAASLEGKLGKSKSTRKQLEGHVAEMKQALQALNNEKLEAEKRIKEFEELTAKFKSLTDTGKIAIKIVDGQMVVAMSSDVLFGTGSSRLSPDGLTTIQQVTPLLVSVPNRRFQIEGFTDNVPIKTAKYPSNWELASGRAMTVLKAMLDAGMPPNRVSAASFGETHPVASNDTDQGRAANRRIEIVVVPDLSTLPGYAQLKKLSGP